MAMVKPNNSFNAENNPIRVEPEPIKDLPIKSMSLLDIMAESTVTMKTLRARSVLLSRVQSDWKAGRIGMIIICIFLIFYLLFFISGISSAYQQGSWGIM